METAPRIRRPRAIGALLGLSLLTLASMAAAAPAESPSRSPARAFLRLEVAKRPRYVGESIPITVRAYFRADTGVTVTGAPTFSHSEFVVQAGEPTQGQATLGGTTYRVMTWKDRLSPVKAGQYRLGVELPSTIEWQDVVAVAPAAGAEGAHDPLGDLFEGDPFFSGADPLFGGSDPFQGMQQRMQQMMNRAMARSEVAGPVQRRSIVSHAPESTLEVRPLPSAGRPADFSGAVGQFALAASAEPTAVHAGEPITLSLHVSGEGNFERVNLPGLADSGEFKTYPPNSVGSEREKTFRQPVIPLRAGITMIPSTSFSFFDPEQAQFVTLSTPPIAIDVAPGSSVIATSSGAITSASSGPALEPNADSLGHPVASLRPVFVRPWFWVLQGGGFASLGAAALIVGGRRRWRADLERSRRRDAERALTGFRARMDQSLAASDSTAFFAAARGALQHSLAAQFQLEPSAITLAEIEARLGPDRVRALRPVFDADAARFSNVAHGAQDLEPWKRTVEQQLAQLKHWEAA